MKPESAAAYQMKPSEVSEATRSPRLSRKRNPDESRRRILDAAEQAFARRGFEGARLRDIAQEAGVHHALVHHYYGDKRGLFKEVVQRALSTISTTNLEGAAGGNDLETVASHLISVLYDFFSKHRDLCRIIESAFRDHDSVAHQLTADALGELAAPLLLGIRGRVKSGQELGGVRKDLDADAMLLFGFGAIVYPFVIGPDLMASLGVTPPSEAELADRKGQLVKYIVTAMKPQR